MADMPFFIPHGWQESERCFNLIVIEINNRFHRANCFSVWCMKCVWNSNIHTYISGSFRLVDRTLAIPVYFKATIGLHGDRNHTSHFENLFCCFIDQNFENKKKIIWKRHPFGIKFHRVFVIALGIKFRKVYIFFSFLFSKLGRVAARQQQCICKMHWHQKKRHISFIFFRPCLSSFRRL